MYFKYPQFEKMVGEMPAEYLRLPACLAVAMWLEIKKEDN